MPITPFRQHEYYHTQKTFIRRILDKKDHLIPAMCTRSKGGEGRLGGPAAQFWGPDSTSAQKLYQTASKATAVLCASKTANVKCMWCMEAQDKVQVDCVLAAAAHS